MQARTKSVRMIRAAMGALAILATCAGAASADPVLSGPTPASIADSRPLLSWVTQPGESAEAVYISRSSAVQATGEFVQGTGNDVLHELIYSNAQSFQTKERLPSGSYFWNLRWETYEPFVDHFSPAVAFTIPTFIKAPAIALLQYPTVPSAYMTVSYETNAPTAAVTCRIYKGAAIVARASVPATAPTTSARTTGYCTMKVPEKLDGTKLRAYAEVKGGGKVAKVSKNFTAK